MYSKVQRADAYTMRLLVFLAQEYGLKATNIVPAKRGFYGETWRGDFGEGGMNEAME